MIEGLRFRPFERSDESELVDFLVAERWPYHSGPAPTEAEIRRRVQAGHYDEPGVETYWVVTGSGLVGLIRLFDLDDDTAMFDLRIALRHRGIGAGTAAVTWLTRHIFTGATPSRVEATTRQDNAAMRSVLAKCGYVKESHYRRAWPGPNGTLHDAVGYAILRDDFLTGTTTPVDWTG